VERKNSECEYEPALERQSEIPKIFRPGKVKYTSSFLGTMTGFQLFIQRSRDSGRWAFRQNVWYRIGLCRHLDEQEFSSKKKIVLHLATACETSFFVRLLFQVYNEGKAPGSNHS